MNRYVTICIIATVKDQADAENVTRVVDAFGQSLSVTGHAAAARVQYVDRVAAPRVVDPAAN